jgi:hypothetical protein
MRLDAILPEVYTFIDFTNHGCFTARKKQQHEYITHLAGDIPSEHPMPYNVYVPVREFLQKNPDQIDELVKYLEDEFKKQSYEFKKVEVTAGKCSIKRRFHRTKEFPQINVRLEW